MYKLLKIVSVLFVLGCLCKPFYLLLISDDSPKDTFVEIWKPKRLQFIREVSSREEGLNLVNPQRKMIERAPLPFKDIQLFVETHDISVKAFVVTETGEVFYTFPTVDKQFLYMTSKKYVEIPQFYLKVNTLNFYSNQFKITWEKDMVKVGTCLIILFALILGGIGLFFDLLRSKKLP